MKEAQPYQAETELNGCGLGDWQVKEKPLNKTVVLRIDKTDAKQKKKNRLLLRQGPDGS